MDQNCFGNMIFTGIYLWFVVFFQQEAFMRIVLKRIMMFEVPARIKKKHRNPHKLLRCSLAFAERENVDLCSQIQQFCMFYPLVN